MKKKYFSKKLQVFCFPMKLFKIFGLDVTVSSMELKKVFIQRQILALKISWNIHRGCKMKLTLMGL